jgi:protein-disulfide isomerase
LAVTFNRARDKIPTIEKEEKTMPRHSSAGSARASTKQQRRQQALRKTRQVRMLSMIAGIAVVAIIAVIVMINANRPEAPVGEIITVEPGDWPQADGKSLGPADAKVVVTEYADFQCPFCRVYNEDIQPRIIEDYVKTGKVRYEYRHFIVIDGNVGGNESRRAAEASECAAQQGNFWDYHEIVFANQGAEGEGVYADNRLKAFAESIGLDTAAFNACFDGKRTASQVTSDEGQARALRLTGTPALLVNGVLVSNPVDYNIVKAAIDSALAANP